MMLDGSRSFVIGDVHACLDELKQLLRKIDYRREHDRLVFVGDLVGRGPYPLETLEFVRDLGSSCVNIMGNHDLALITQANQSKLVSDALSGFHGQQSQELGQRWQDAIDWLAGSPFLYDDQVHGVIVTHAGVPPQLTLTEAIGLARDLERQIRKDGVRAMTSMLSGPLHTDWSSVTSADERMRYAAMGFTRIRFCHPSGSIDLDHRGAPGSQPLHLHPWFQMRHPDLDDNRVLIFGHWAALGFHRAEKALCCDGGCVFGGALMAVELTASFATTRVLSQFNALSGGLHQAERMALHEV